MVTDRVSRRRDAAPDLRTESPERRADDEAIALAAARDDAAGLRQLDVLALQRTLGNAATASLLSRAPVERRAPITHGPLKVQRSFVTKARNRLRKLLGRGKTLKPEAKELLADPTQWERSHAGSASAPARKKAMKAKTPAVFDPRLEPTETKSEGDETLAVTEEKRADELVKSLVEEESESEVGSSDTESEQSKAEEKSEEKSEEMDEESEVGSSDSDSEQSKAEEKADEDEEGGSSDSESETEGAEGESSSEDAEQKLEDSSTRLAGLLAASKELKGAGPYRETKSRGDEYEGEDTEGMAELEERFVKPAREIVKHLLDGTTPDDANAQEWVEQSRPVVAKQREPGAPWAEWSYSQVLKRLMGIRLKTTARWTVDEATRYLSDDGHLNTDKENKAVVKYLDPTEAANYELHRDKGVFTQGTSAEPFTTASMGTNFSGQGYAIFAMGTDGRIYAESHRVGLFHHSSFLAGGDVASAGELKVSDGKLEHVTNKTGHYRAEEAHLAQVLERFEDWGISLATFDVSVITADTTKESVKKEKADEFYLRYKGAK